ncbi:putative pollen-specific leucine-rich repeat extensin-like protein 3 [Iris pallida]|uniref:Pollen-specific leucine-rich repeat extensin-like protein 3 n=1 Tax=Iris pallida TaxID=29817 RepID=A0AAX6FCW2_IRIPA|nr:putative pollen-specific leucine-rich repeat extensin-like protein 3 [Iris pallida]
MLEQFFPFLSLSYPFSLSTFNSNNNFINIPCTTHISSLSSLTSRPPAIAVGPQSPPPPSLLHLLPPPLHIHTHHRLRLLLLHPINPPPFTSPSPPPWRVHGVAPPPLAARSTPWPARQCAAVRNQLQQQQPSTAHARMRMDARERRCCATVGRPLAGNSLP